MCVKSGNPCREHLPPGLSLLLGPQYLWREDTNVGMTVDMGPDKLHEDFLNSYFFFFGRKSDYIQIDKYRVSTHKFSS